MIKKYWFISKIKEKYIISSKIWKDDTRDNNRYNNSNYFEHFEDAFIALIAATSNKEDKKEEIL